MASLSPFFGVKLSGNVVKSVKDLQVQEEECLHLSAACLQQAESGSTEYVLSVVKTGGEPIVICILNSQSRQVHLDLVLDNTDSLQLKVNGKDTKNAVHISGFFDVESGDDDDDEASDDGQMELVKPVEDMDDTNASDGQQSASDSDAAEEDEEEEESDADVAPVETPEVQVAAAAAVSSSDDDENENENEDDSSDEQGSGSEQGSDSGSGSDSEEEPPVPEPKKQAAPAKKQAAPPAKKKQVEEVKKVDQKKRKAEAAHPEASPSKKSNNEVDTYVSSVVKFLKARGGVARIGVIGGQCKKPASVKGLTKLFTDRQEFKVSGEEVHLA